MLRALRGAQGAWSESGRVRSLQPAGGRGRGRQCRRRPRETAAGRKCTLRSAPRAHQPESATRQPPGRPPPPPPRAAPRTGLSVRKRPSHPLGGSPPCVCLWLVPEGTLAWPLGRCSERGRAQPAPCLSRPPGHALPPRTPGAAWHDRASRASWQLGPGPCSHAWPGQVLAVLCSWAPDNQVSSCHGGGHCA